MLKKIILDNYTTFFSPTTIDFTATNYKFLEEENIGTNRILKGALFVGENASGKTKILEAITILLDILFGNKEIDFVSKKSFYTTKKNYKLGYVFEILGKEIKYNLELSMDGILGEELNYDGRVVLSRLGSNAKFSLNEEKLFNDISSKLSFLRRIYFDTNFYDDECLNKWFLFMKSSVYVNCYDKRIVSYSGTNLLVHKYLNENDTNKINDFFKNINYKQQIEYNKEIYNLNSEYFIKSDDEFISFKKTGTNVFIPEAFESTGNKTLVEILPSFLHAVDNECMFIVDEFSSGLHNELEESLIKYFFHFSKNSQLFFNSHSTNILNNTLLRPDQIYSVSFDPKVGSVLKRFSSESPRENQNTEKMYLSGVFDGMPRYNKIFKD